MRVTQETSPLDAITERPQDVDDLVFLWENQVLIHSDR